MSFEGYYQYLCKNGHLSIRDVYFDDLKKCGDCKAPIIWHNLVDQTNDEGKPVKLKIKLQKSCRHCNSVLETIYYIPKK